MLKKDVILETLAESYLHNPSHRNGKVIPQFQHRLSLASKWDIAPGSHILELGCGQGETTLVLAHLVGPTGSVVGVDPAQLDYGLLPRLTNHLHTECAYLFICRPSHNRLQSAQSHQIIFLWSSNSLPCP